MRFTDQLEWDGISPDHALPAWGGARNRAGKASNALSFHQAESVIAAARHVQSIGSGFNRFITIHWTRAGVADADAARATGRVLKLASDWMASKGARIAYAWVRENDEGDGSKGAHVHILLHCPASLPIGRMWRRWLRKVTGNPYRKGVIKSVSIGGCLACYVTAPARYADNLGAVIAYCVKGVSPANATVLGLPRQVNGGRIIGKRAAWSQHLGAKVRVLSGKR